MARLYLLLFLINLALSVIALIGCLSAEDGEIRALPRIAWVFIILLFSPIGPIAWFIAGRPRPAGGETRPSRSGPSLPGGARPRPLAPDDDPEFLRSLRERQERSDQDRLERWEADLRQREERLRQRKPEDNGTPEDRPA